MLLFRIKSEPGVAYESVSYKKTSKVVSWSSKHEEITFPCEFSFVFNPYFFGVILSKKVLSKVVGSDKNYTGGAGHIGGLLIGGLIGGFKTSVHFGFKNRGCA